MKEDSIETKQINLQSHYWEKLAKIIKEDDEIVKILGGNQFEAILYKIATEKIVLLDCEIWELIKKNLIISDQQTLNLEPIKQIFYEIKLKNGELLQVTSDYLPTAKKRFKDYIASITKIENPYN